MLKNFGIFRPRYLHFKAYYNLIKSRPLRAMHLLNKSFIEANKCGGLYDVEWCLQSKNSWFPGSTFINKEIENEDNEDTVFMYRFQN